MLSGRKISILTNSNNGQYDILVRVLTKMGAETHVCVVNAETIVQRCCDHSKMCDCVIFDTDDPSASLSAIKKRCDGFSSIMYMRNAISETTSTKLWACLHRFDQVLNSPEVIRKSRALKDIPQDIVEAVYEYEVGQAICSAIAIHKKRKQDYDRLLSAFVDSYPFASDYIMLCAVDEYGKISSCDKTAKSLFGDDMPGKNFMSYIVGKHEHPPVHIGRMYEMVTKEGTVVQMKLVGSYELTNGVTYHLQTWEIFSETESLLKAVQRLESTSQRAQEMVNGGNGTGCV